MPHGYSGIPDDRCVVVHPTNPLIMYKGVPGNASEGRGIIRSQDGGYNWTPVFSICTIDPTRMAIFPEYPERVIFGNGKGQFEIGGGCLYRTTDEGTSWDDVTPAQTGGYLFSVTDFYIHPVNENRIYVSADSSNDDPVNPLYMGVWESTNYGSNWEQIGRPGEYGQPYVMEYPVVNCVAVGANNYVYAGFGPTEAVSFGGIQRSMNGGVNWTTVHTIEDYPVSDLLVDPDNDNIVYVAISKILDKSDYFNGQGILRSTDYGITWQPYNEGLGDKYVYQLRVNRYNHNHLYTGTFQSFYYRDKSITPSEWQRRNAGINVEAVTKILPSTSYRVYALIIRGLIKKGEIEAPYKWDLVSTIGPDEHYFLETRAGALYPPDQNNILVGYNGLIHLPEQNPQAFIIRSTNSGETWSLSWQHEPQHITRVNCISHSPDLPEITYAGLYGSRYFMLKSINAGVNWTELEPPHGTLAFDVMCIAQEDHDNLFTGDYSLYQYGVYRSIDAGENWESFNEGFSPVPQISCLVIDSSVSPSLIHCGTLEQGFFRRKIDEGSVWEAYNNGLAYLNIRDVEIDKEEPTLIYSVANEYTGLSHTYLTVDRGAMWINIDQGLPSIEIWDIALHQNYYLYAATPLNGIYRYQIDFNKSLVSSSDEATFSNASHKMIRGGIDDFWITYESGGVIYAVHSGDGGQTWSKKMEIGYGCNPAISTNPNAETPEPAIVWRSQNHNTLYFARHISGSNWTSPIVLQTSVNGFGPPSFVIGTDNFGRVVYSEFDGQSDKIYLYKFHIYFPFPGIPALIDEGIDPSIDFMLPDGINPEIHVAWVKSNGVWYSSKFISGTSWLNKQRIIPFGVQPRIEVCGANVYVVCKRHKTISHRWASYANGNPTWSGISVPNFSQTATHSVYPVLTGGWSCAWTEQESDSDIYFSYYDPALGWVDPMNISNTTESSAHAHIVHKQTVNQTTIYFIWVEKDNAPYHIEFVSEIFGDRDKGEDYDLPFYIADGGKENASPFNLHREGYLQYGPEPYKRIDYDAEYLEYQFANLNPDREYGAGVYLYQHGSSSLAISAEVDGYQIGALNLPPDTLIILRHMLPTMLYEDSTINVKIFGNDAVSAALVIYEYENDSTGGGGPQSLGDLPLNFDSPIMSVFPNPVQKEINIQYTLFRETEVNLSIFDVAGRSVRNVISKNQISGTYHKSLSIANLPQGVYFIKLDTSDDTIVQKVIFIK
ncbi:MAG: T9SS type A sorting domain-containing protein [bacterium]